MVGRDAETTLWSEVGPHVSFLSLSPRVETPRRYGPLVTRLCPRDYSSVGTVIVKGLFLSVLSWI